MNISAISDCLKLGIRSYIGVLGRSAMSRIPFLYHLFFRLNWLQVSPLLRPPRRRELPVFGWASTYLKTIA